MDNLGVLYIPGIAFAIAALFYLFSLGRAKAFETAAREMNFEFEGNTEPFRASVGVSVPMQLFNDDDDGEVQNVSRGFAAGKEAVLFDYVISRRVWHFPIEEGQTVAAFKISRSRFPDFQLQRRRLHLFSHAKYTEPFDLEDVPEFTRAYRLSGWERDVIRRKFDPVTIGFFMEQKKFNWAIEKAGDWLLLYVRGKRVPTKRLRDFLESSQQVANQLDA